MFERRADCDKKISLEETGMDRSCLARLEAGRSTILLERALRALRRMGATVTISLSDEDAP